MCGQQKVGWLYEARFWALCIQYGYDGQTTERFGVQLPRARWTKPSKYQRSCARSGLLQRRVGRELSPICH